MIARLQQTRRGMFRRALIAAPAAALLGVVPLAAADPPPPLLSLNLPPLLSLTVLAPTPPPPALLDLSIPAPSTDLPPGLRLLIPEIVDLAVPVDLGATGLPLGGVRLSLPNIDLPSNISIFAGSLLGISGLGDLVASLAPSLSLAPDLAVGASTKDLDLTCQLEATITLPEDDTTPITGPVTLTGCTSGTGVPYRSASGELKATGSVEQDPTGFHGTQLGTLTLTWDNKEESAVNVNSTTQGPSRLENAPIEGPAPIMARVTGGALQGDRVELEELAVDFTETGLSFRGAVFFMH